MTSLINTFDRNDYDSDAQALFARMSTQPTPTRKSLISALILDLKDQGFWDILDIFCILAGHDPDDVLLSWKGAEGDLVDDGSGTFAWTEDSHVSGTGFEATGFNTTTGASLTYHTDSSAMTTIWPLSDGNLDYAYVGTQDFIRRTSGSLYSTILQASPMGPYSWTPSTGGILTQDAVGNAVGHAQARLNQTSNFYSTALTTVGRGTLNANGPKMEAHSARVFIVGGSILELDTGSTTTKTDAFQGLIKDYIAAL